MAARAEVKGALTKLPGAERANKKGDAIAASPFFMLLFKF
jgi:hypothetical protein